MDCEYYIFSLDNKYVLNIDNKYEYQQIINYLHKNSEIVFGTGYNIYIYRLLLQLFIFLMPIDKDTNEIIILNDDKYIKENISLKQEVELLRKTHQNKKLYLKGDIDDLKNKLDEKNTIIDKYKTKILEYKKNLQIINNTLIETKVKNDICEKKIIVLDEKASSLRLKEKELDKLDEDLFTRENIFNAQKYHYDKILSKFNITSDDIKEIIECNLVMQGICNKETDIYQTKDINVCENINEIIEKSLFRKKIPRNINQTPNISESDIVKNVVNLLPPTIIQLSKDRLKNIETKATTLRDNDAIIEYGSILYDISTKLLKNDEEWNSKYMLLIYFIGLYNKMPLKGGNIIKCIDKSYIHTDKVDDNLTADDEDKLERWCNLQKRLYRKKKLESDKILLLENIKIWKWK